jgi:hypothetical protein
MVRVVLRKALETYFAAGEVTLAEREAEVRPVQISRTKPESTDDMIGYGDRGRATGRNRDRQAVSIAERTGDPMTPNEARPVETVCAPRDGRTDGFATYAWLRTVGSMSISLDETQSLNYSRQPVDLV